MWRWGIGALAASLIVLAGLTALWFEPQTRESSQAPKASHRSELKVGIHTNAAGYGMHSEEALELVEPTRAKWIREDFSWSTVQPRKGEWDWRVFDHLLLEAARRDLRILPIVSGVPDWAGAAWNEVPRRAKPYANYAARLAARYGPGGSFIDDHPQLRNRALRVIEVWNEPYFEMFSLGGPKPARYARLVRETGRAVARANPRVKIAAEIEKVSDGSILERWIDRMYRAVPRLNQFYDIAAIHPYTGPVSPHYRARSHGFRFSRLGEIRRELRSHKAGNKPFWLTEYGWSTCADPGSCVSEREQARYLRQSFKLIRNRYHYVRAAFVYHRTDLDYGDPRNWHAFFGMQRLNGSKKPVYRVFAREARRSG